MFLNALRFFKMARYLEQILVAGDFMLLPRNKTLSRKRILYVDDDQDTCHDEDCPEYRRL
jgi:hypothetical protein